MIGLSGCGRGRQHAADRGRRRRRRRAAPAGSAAAAATASSRRADRAAGDAGLPAPLVLERVHDSARAGRARSASGASGIGPRSVAGSRSRSKQVHGDLHAADAVGDGVVDLHDEAGPPVGQAVDDDELPQRPGPVEALHGDRLRPGRGGRGASRRRRPASNGGGSRGRSWGRPPSGAGRSTAGSTRRAGAAGARGEWLGRRSRRADRDRATDRGPPPT